MWEPDILLIVTHMVRYNDWGEKQSRENRFPALANRFSHYIWTERDMVVPNRRGESWNKPKSLNKCMVNQQGKVTMELETYGKKGWGDQCFRYLFLLFYLTRPVGLKTGTTEWVTWQEFHYCLWSCKKSRTPPALTCPAIVFNPHNELIIPGSYNNRNILRMNFIRLIKI